MNTLPPLTQVGRIGRRHGTRGELTLHLTHALENSENEMPAYVFVTLDSLPVPYFINHWRGKGGASYIVRFDGVDSEESAAELVGCEISLPTDEVPTRQGETSGWHAFVGYRVETAQGLPIGKVTAVDDRNANILLYVTTENGKEVLLPLHDDFVSAHYEEERLLRLDLPQGILSINE